MTDNDQVLANDASMEISRRLRSAWLREGITVPELLARMGSPIKFGEPGYQNQYMHLHSRLAGVKSLVKVDPTLFPLARALGIDPAELVASVIRDCAA